MTRDAKAATHSCIGHSSGRLRSSLARRAVYLNSRQQDGGIGLRLVKHQGVCQRLLLAVDHGVTAD